MPNLPMHALVRAAVAALVVGVTGDWNGPTVMALVIATAVSAFDLGRRDRDERDTAAGFLRDPYGLAMQLAFLALMCAGAWDNRAPHRTWQHPGVYGMVGAIVLLTGIRLRQSAARALGRHFTVVLSVLPDHELVSTGPYRWLRHPNYAGLLLVALGTGIMVRSPLFLAGTALLWLPLALLRIRQEERALRGRLGARWTEYADGRWSLVPGVY
jgi:protein-S-isoprenylcysteine O-methyltransferase Ste14